MLHTCKAAATATEKTNWKRRSYERMAGSVARLFTIEFDVFLSLSILPVCRFVFTPSPDRHSCSASTFFPSAFALFTFEILCAWHNILIHMQCDVLRPSHVNRQIHADRYKPATRLCRTAHCLRNTQNSEFAVEKCVYLGFVIGNFSHNECDNDSPDICPYLCVPICANISRRRPAQNSLFFDFAWRAGHDTPLKIAGKLKCILAIKAYRSRQRPRRRRRLEQQLFSPSLVRALREH